MLLIRKKTNATYIFQIVNYYSILLVYPSIQNKFEVSCRLFV